MVKERMVQNSVQSLIDSDDHNKEDWENIQKEDIFDDNEFADINAKLDQLSSLLDFIEKKNDDIRAKLMETLQSNREARKQLQESSKEEEKIEQ